MLAGVFSQYIPAPIEVPPPADVGTASTNCCLVVLDILLTDRSVEAVLLNLTMPTPMSFWTTFCRK